MNERLKELAKQAGLEPTSGSWCFTPGIDVEISKSVANLGYSKELEKFAELIVRKCANIVSNKVTLETNEDYREGFHRARQFIWQDIKQHFGVENERTN